MNGKILVIDDEELLTKTLTKLLEKYNYDVLVARRGEDAEAVADADQFDLIICDVRMPGMDGVATITKIRNSAGINVATPVIFVTGYADKKMETVARALNPIAYMQKPFDAEQILQVIKAAIQG